MILSFLYNAINIIPLVACLYFLFLLVYRLYWIDVFVNCKLYIYIYYTKKVLAHYTALDRCIIKYNQKTNKGQAGWAGKPASQQAGKQKQKKEPSLEQKMATQPGKFPVNFFEK